MINNFASTIQTKIVQYLVSHIVPGQYVFLFDEFLIIFASLLQNFK